MRRKKEKGERKIYIKMKGERERKCRNLRNRLSILRRPKNRTNASIRFCRFSNHIHLSNLLARMFTDSRIFLPLSDCRPPHSRERDEEEREDVRRYEIRNFQGNVLYAPLPKCILSEPGIRSIPR